jgi:tol-pal system protein YbgF
VSWRGAWRSVLPAVALAAGGVVAAGCFATREDVQTLQTDLQTMRAQAAHDDSVRGAQISALSITLGVMNDSVHGLSTRLTKWQGDVRGDLYAVQQELIQIQELTGQSQRRLQELRAGLEAKGQSIVEAPSTGGQPAGMGAMSAVDSARVRGTPGAVPPPTSPSSNLFGTAPTTTPGMATTGAAPGAGAPGPNQLFQLALDQLRRGSTGAARAGFSDLLRQYPNADVAAEAQFYLAETYANEGNMAAADSGYQAVVAKYPSSLRAPTALYKHGVAMQAAGNVQAARAALEDVIRKYPRSDEAVLAKDRLRTLR